MHPDEEKLQRSGVELSERLAPSASFMGAPIDDPPQIPRTSQRYYMVLRGLRGPHYAERSEPLSYTAEIIFFPVWLFLARIFVQ